MRSREHWEGVYERKRPDEVSWYRPHLERSLQFIDAAGLRADAAIIDVGGGASTLVDDLLARGHSDVTVLDVSARAIESAKARLADRAARVHWLVADITQSSSRRRRTTSGTTARSSTSFATTSSDAATSRP